MPSPRKFSWNSFGSTSNGSSFNPATNADVIKVCGTMYSVSRYFPVFPSALGIYNRRFPRCQLLATVLFSASFSSSERFLYLSPKKSLARLPICSTAVPAPAITKENHAALFMPSLRSPAISFSPIPRFSIPSSPMNLLGSSIIMYAYLPWL